MNNLKLINNFLRYLSDKGVSSTSLKYYKSDIVKFLTWRGERDITNHLVKEYLNSIRLTTPNATINRQLSTLRSFAQFTRTNFMQGIENVSYKTSENKSEADRNINETVYSKISSLFSKNQKAQSLIYNILFNRPNWYKKYHAYPIANYVHIAILILFSSLSGYAVYDQVFYSTDRSFAFPSALERPNRYLSFQGRLTDNLGNPETTATNMVFKLYDVSSGGTALWDSGTCSITPDQDGIFSTLLGSSCGSEISSSVFSENAEVWLGVTVAGDAEATPRIQIATVAYALNSETLQGFPAGTGTSTIPYIDSTGKLAIAASSPTIESTSGTFAVKGQAMTISTADTTNGDITINPDGTGTLNLTFEGASPDGGANGFVNATNANITSGSLYSGTIASNATGYNFINFLSGSSPTSKFSVQDDGDILTSGDITIGGGNINTGNIALTIGDGTTDSVTISTDGTGNGEVVLPNDSIGPNELMSSGQVDEYCLTYEATGTTLEWQLCGAGGSSQWNDLTAPDGNLTLAHGTNTTEFNWDTGTGSNDLFSFTTDASSNGTGTLLNIQTGTSSTVNPFRVRSGSAESIFVNATGNVGIGTITQDRKFEILDASNPQLRLSQSDNTNYTDFQVNSSGDLNINVSGGDIIFANNNILNIGGSGTDTAFNIIGDSAAGASANVNSDNDLYIEGNLEVDGTIYDSSGNPLTNYWSLSSGKIFPATLTNLVGIGTNSPISRLSVINNPGAGNYTGKAAFLVDQYESQDILTASASGVTKLTLQNDGTLKLHNSSSTISNDSGDIVLNSAGGDFDFSADNIINLATLNAVTGIFSGVIQSGDTSATTYSRLGNGTTGHAGNISSASDLLLQDLEVDGTLFLDGGNIANSGGTVAVALSGTPIDTANTLSAGSWVVDNTTNVGKAALVVNQTKSGDLFTASSSGIPRFTIQNDGDVVLTNGQLRLGNLSSAPTAEGAGSMFFNTTTNTNQCYNGTNWYNCGGTLYSNTNASVADGSYITVTHNLATNDLLSSAWINSQGAWKSLDATYKPAIAWEGKDTQKGLYHNSLNEYTINNEAGAATSTIHSGMIFDTFEDAVKTDSANTTASLNSQIGDDGSSNFITLDQRIQTGRTGLMGGQTLSTSETDNDGQTYLGSNTVNDIYYYDRGRDSIPEVLVELGIDPNWYNGVTLSVATSSASYAQSGTLADKNPNLTTTYNGGLIKATGTDTDPRTIYITIKSPTTFDWTNYQGDSASGVTITPGTAQTLGTTGVSVTFTGGVNYNVGDVFRIASWYIEPVGSTRGAKREFPERSNIIATSSSVDIIDADTQKLWMRFGNTGIMAGTQASVSALNGKVYGAEAANSYALRLADFSNDRGYVFTTLGLRIRDSIAQRALTGSGTLINSSLAIVSNTANDVSTAIIPNHPTQEITVSGWGYIQGAAATTISETVNLPYTFNSIPNVTSTVVASKATTAPATLSECTGGNQRIAGMAVSITNNTFVQRLSSSDAADGNFSTTTYYCYTWTATGTVSPKQFVAVATGATGADGGTTVINETDGTKADILIGSLHADLIWQTHLAFAGNNLYSVDSVDAATDAEYLVGYNGVHGLKTETSWAQYANEPYKVAGDGTYASSIILGTSSAYNQIKSLYATSNTSTLDGISNTIYAGTSQGLTVLQTIQNYSTGTDSHNGVVSSYPSSVKYYTKDYISEEMIGDIRGMWPLNNANSSSDFEDVSIKGNHLTGTNITANGDSVSGVRGTATDFDGSTEYLSCTDAACGGTSKLDVGTSDFSLGLWFKTSVTASTTIMRKGSGGDAVYLLRTSPTTGKVDFLFGASASYVSMTSNRTINDNQWHHVVVSVKRNGLMELYIDGQLDVSSDASSKNGVNIDSVTPFTLGAYHDGASPSNYFTGSIDEPFVTATALTPAQIKNMYQVGYRALQSHGTGLSSGSADGNQALAGASNNIGVVAPDYNNQYLYVGTNHTTDGALTKIQINSDTAIKNWDTGDNDPDGGAQIVDDDITSLAVGETLYAVGSAASGIKSMGLDDNATATSGNFVSKTFTLPKNIGSAVLWVSPVTDSSDGSNTITVQASNDGGSNYVTCTLVGTDSNYTVAEKEYACTFATADNDLKVRFQFARGSTKTNTYVAQYGISWLGETGFRVEQADNNNVRLYNFSGETQNLKLNVTGASTAALANPWTDAGSYLYATGYETLRIYDGAGTNYLGLSHDGTLANLTYNGTTVLSINSTGDLLPNTDDTQNIGSDTKRWKDLFLGGDTLHIGTSLTDEGTIAYNTTNNILNFGTDSTTNGDIAFFTDDLYLDKSTGHVGVGTTSPLQRLHLSGGDMQIDNNRFIRFRNAANSGDGALILTSGNDFEWRDPSSGNTTFTIDVGGNVGIGSTSPGESLEIRTTGTFPMRLYNNSVDSTEYWSVGPVGSDNFAIFNNSSTGLYIAYGATSWTANSDERLKTNISPISDVEGLDALLQLNPVDYKWKNINTNQEKQTGFLAQEVQRLFPNLVSLGETTTITLEDGTTQTIESPLGVNYTGFIPYIIKGIQEQQEQINNLLELSIASVQNIVAPNTNTNIISPVADSNLIIDLDPNNNNSVSKLAIKGVNDEEVASIDSTGNANFEGNTNTNTLTVENTATISGTLFADDIKSTKLEEIENLLRDVEENQELLANSWDVNTIADQGILDLETVETDDLFVTGIAAINNLTLSNSFTLGSDFIFQATDNSINTLNSPLRLQSLAMSPLEIMAGKVIIDTNGDTMFTGNVEIAGNLKVNGDTEIEKAVINNFVIANNVDEASESAEIIEGVITTNSVAGKAVLVSESEKIRINNIKVKDSTLVYVTPITSTQNKVLYVKEKGEGYFEIGFDEPLESDVEFNWWIIELQNNNFEEDTNE